MSDKLQILISDTKLNFFKTTFDYYDEITNHRQNGSLQSEEDTVLKMLKVLVGLCMKY